MSEPPLRLQGTLPVERCNSTQEALALFDSLAGIDVEFMLGDWVGKEFPSGHPLDGLLAVYGWRGKRFDSEEHVWPLLFASGGREFAVHPRPVLPAARLVLRLPWLKNARLARVLQPALRLLATRRSRARLRMLRFRGCLSASLVYDDVPVEDVFRRVGEDTVLGLMNLKGLGQPFFFLLRRRRDSALLQSSGTPGVANHGG